MSIIETMFYIGLSIGYGVFVSILLFDVDSL
jgi:hypothetical protein